LLLRGKRGVARQPKLGKKNPGLTEPFPKKRPSTSRCMPPAVVGEVSSIFEWKRIKSRPPLFESKRAGRGRAKGEGEGWEERS